MAYTTINKPTDYFNTKLYTGNSGNGNNPVAVGFQPDFTWFKSRTQGYNNYLIDAIRGDEKYISSDNSNAEASWGANDVTWTSTGFTLNTTGGSGINEGVQGTDNMCSWNWKANGAGSANTDGSINSTVSANTTSGFSISTWNEVSSSSAQTIGHGLGVAPDMMIMKRRTDSGSSWLVYHKSIGNTGAVFLDATASTSTSASYWNNTSPTPSVFTLSAGWNGSASNTWVSYNFAEKQGYSKFGSYVGNGNADGTFVYTGFKSSFILLKKSSGAGTDWYIFNNKSPGYNDNNKSLRANTTATEASASGYSMDILSNGFKIRTSNTALGESGATYIYMAFAEAPLVGTNGVTAKAR